jgi:hypothetical protein
MVWGEWSEKADSIGMHLLSRIVAPFAIVFPRSLERRRSVKAILAIVASFVLSTGIQSRARGTEEWSFEAVQPIWTDNTLYLSHVTVLTFNSGETGIHAALATCDSNQVMTDYGPQQRNAAFAVGLRVEVTFNSNREPPLFGDTLRVVLRGTKRPADLGDFSYATIVAATVQCILVNAAQSATIKFVALRVEGEAPYRKYGGIFGMAAFRNGPRQREFRDP